MLDLADPRPVQRCLSDAACSTQSTLRHAALHEVGVPHVRRRHGLLAPPGKPGIRSVSLHQLHGPRPHHVRESQPVGPTTRCKNPCKLRSSGHGAVETRCRTDGRPRPHLRSFRGCSRARMLVAVGSRRSQNTRAAYVRWLYVYIRWPPWPTSSFSSCASSAANAEADRDTLCKQGRHHVRFGWWRIGILCRQAGWRTSEEGR